MKALVTYYTDTGNTEKIARAAHAELAKSGDADLKALDDASPDDLSGYDLVVVSSPIHGGGLAAPMQEFLKGVAAAPGFKLAALITHLSTIYETQAFETGLKLLKETAAEKQIDYLGYYDCQGKLAAEIRPMVQKGRGMSDEEFGQYMDELDQHPTPDEVAAAAAFAGDLIAKL